MKSGQRIRCTNKQSENLPEYLIGKKGAIIKRCKPEDGVPMYAVQFDCRKTPAALWVDEFVAI